VGTVTRSRKTKTKAKSNGKATKPTIRIPGPGELTEPPDNILEYRICIYGESAVGKTSLVAQIPNSYIIQGDVQRKGLRVRQSLIPNCPLNELQSFFKEHGTTPWEMTREFIKQASTDDTVEVLILDSADSLYNHCHRYICWKMGIQHPNDTQPDYGASWTAIKEEFHEGMHPYVESGKGLVFVCHNTEREIPDLATTNAKGKEIPFMRQEPEAQKALFEHLKKVTDFALYFNFRKGKRTLHIRNYDAKIWTKCSTDEDESIRHFFDPEGNPLSMIDMGNSPGEGWENLNKAFDNEMFDVDYKPKPKKTVKRRRSSS
jgi:hypothetical protein